MQRVRTTYKGLIFKMVKKLKKPELRLDLKLTNNSLTVAHSFPVAFSVVGLGVFAPDKKWTRGNEHKCSCVFACPQFKTYEMGRECVRIIPRNATCPYIPGACLGAHWFSDLTLGYRPYNNEKDTPVHPWHKIANAVEVENWRRQKLQEQRTQQNAL